MPPPAPLRTRRAQVLALAVAIAVTILVWLNARNPGPRDGGRPRRTDRRSVLLVTVDTLRADHVGCYGYGRDTTPNLDRLAAEGVRFDQATTPRGKTQPSVVSLLTGLYPHEHGIRINIGLLPPVRLGLDLERPLRPAASTPVLLAEELSAAGLATGGFVGNFVLTAERSGLQRGFDVYDDEMTSTELGREDAPERKARDNTDRALRWLDRHADEAFFLWVHYIDPHGTYEPPAEYDRFEGPPLRRVPLGAMRQEVPVDETGRRILVPPHNLVIDPATGKRELSLGRYVDLYDGEIAYTDAELGRLLARLAEHGRTDDTLVIVTADHGESLGEHEIYFEHGYYTYDVSVRVPLVVRMPGAEVGRVVGAPVDLIDVRPTVLDWLDLAEPRAPHATASFRGPVGGSGRSLLDVLRGGAGDESRIAFTERSEFGSVMRAARTPRWKLIHNLATPPEWPLIATRELYDLAADPYEETNLHDADDARAAEARERLGEALDAWLRGAGDVRSYVGEDLEAVAGLPSEDLRTLQGIGYVDSETAERAERGDATDDFYRRPPPETDDPEEVLAWALGSGPELRALATEALARHGRLDVRVLISNVAPDMANAPGASVPLEVRVRSAELAGELGRAEAIPALERSLAHAPEPALRAACAYALELLEPRAEDRGQEALDEAAAHASAGVRGLAAWYLGRLGRLEPVRALTRDGSGVVRAFAWQALAEAAPDEDRAPALAALEREATGADPLEVQAAALALARLRPPEENRALVQALRTHAHPWIVAVGRELAVWTSPGEALAALRGREELPPRERRRLVNAAAAVAGALAEAELRAALSDSDADVRVIAAAHLMRLGGGGR